MDFLLNHVQFRVCTKKRTTMTMDRFVTFLCIAVVTIGAISLPFNKEMAVMECKAQYVVPKSDVELIQNRKMPETQQGKCMMACIMKKMKVMTKDGQYDLKNVKKWMRTTYKGDNAKLTKAVAMADECAKELLPGVNECDLAIQIMDCSRRKARLAKKASKI